MLLRRCAVLLATSLPVAISGCSSATNATDSTVSYIRGDQRATVGAAPPAIAAAAVAAASELSLPVDSNSSDGLVGKVMMHTSDGTKVEVNIKGESDEQSEVTVRVGTFGDKALQQRVLDTIKTHLTDAASSTALTSPAATPPAAPRAAAPLAPASPPKMTLSPTLVPAPAPSSPAPAPMAPAPAASLTPVNPLVPVPDSAPVNPLAPNSPPATMPSHL